MKKLLSVFILTLIFVSCKKYEDGPYLSLRSPEKRLTGKWGISKILFNEKDISPGYFSSSLDLYPFNIYSDWSGQYFICISHTDGNVIAKSDLKINKKKTRITFALKPLAPYQAISDDIFSIIYILPTSTEWKILRLKNDELWIATDFDTNNFELRFDLIADYSDY